MSKPKSIASLRGTVGAYRLHATHDPRTTTLAARTAFAASFESKVDPEGTLSTAERHRRAECEKKAFYARLTLAATSARRQKATKNRRGVA